jgi:hypothetical protein
MLKTDITKLVVHTIVISKTSDLTKSTIAAHTTHEEDDISVIVTGAVVGAVVADRTQPFADNAIDKIAAWIKTKKEARNNK